MFWTGTDWTVVASQAAGVAAVLYAGYKWLDKRFPKQVNAVEKAAAKILPGAVVTGVEDAAKLVENLVKSPWFAPIAAKSELEAHHIIGKLEHTTAVSEAKTILLGIGKAYAALTDQEKVKAEVTLRLVLNQLGIDMVDKQIQSVFSEAQKAIDSLKQTAVFKASFEQPASKAASTKEQKSQQETNQQQPQQA